MTSLIFNKKFMKLVEILLIIFSLYVSYQIIKKVIGGSWQAEVIIIAIVLANLGITFKLVSDMGELKSDHKNLKNQFYSLTTDFKKVKTDVSELSHKFDFLAKDVRVISKELTLLRKDFKSFNKRQSKTL